jgi:hypothetical protein
VVLIDAHNRAQDIYSKHIVGPKEQDVGLDTKAKSQLGKEIHSPDVSTFNVVQRHILATLDKELKHFENCADSVISDFEVSPASMLCSSSNNNNPNNKC